MDLKEKVYSFKTKYKEGFTYNEVEELLLDFPNINKEKFDNALTGITVKLIDGHIIIYCDDVLNALRCGLENRDLYSWEWD